MGNGGLIIPPASYKQIKLTERVSHNLSCGDTLGVDTTELLKVRISMATYQPDPQMVETAPVTSNESIEDLLEDNAGINHVEVIETVIDSLEQDDSAMVSRSPEGGYLWKFNYGSVEVFVQLTGTRDTDTLTVWSSVRPLPAKDEPGLMRHLLEMNGASTFESRFAIIDNQVVVLATRTLADLSATEVSRLITVVASIADENDESLKSKF
jgi:hypothetical protein